MSDKIELLPCPFCGKALQINQRKHNPFARCATAGCVGGKLPLLNIELAEDVEAWNRRAALAQQPAAAVPHLTAPELSDLMDFHSAVCCDEGHTVKKEGMRRLAQIGAVESVGFGKHRLTEFGVYLLAAAPAAPASDRLEKLLAEEERSHDLTMRQRDRAEEMATELAEAIGEYFGCDVGEHSSGNCPWENALGVIHAAPAAPVAVQEPVAWVLLHNGEVAYDRDEAIISNRPGDCLDESYEWRAVYAAPAAPVAVQPLPYWAPCNPACDPELNGRRSKRCDCAQAKAALGDQLAAAPAAPVAQEPVAQEPVALEQRATEAYALLRRVYDSGFDDDCVDAVGDWLNEHHTSPAAEQPDTVAVPRGQLEQLLDRVAHREDPDKIANELCSILLGKEGEA